MSFSLDNLETISVDDAKALKAKIGKALDTLMSELEAGKVKPVDFGPKMQEGLEQIESLNGVIAEGKYREGKSYLSASKKFEMRIQFVFTERLSKDGVILPDSQKVVAYVATRFGGGFFKSIPTGLLGHMLTAAKAGKDSDLYKIWAVVKHLNDGKAIKVANHSDLNLPTEEKVFALADLCDLDTFLMLVDKAKIQPRKGLESYRFTLARQVSQRLEADLEASKSLAKKARKAKKSVVEIRDMDDIDDDTDEIDIDES